MEEYQIIDISFASTDTTDIELLTKLKSLHVELTELSEHLEEHEEAKAKNLASNALIGKCDFMPCCHTIESRIQRDYAQLEAQTVVYQEAKRAYQAYDK
jgi:hypothetical protein